MCTCAMTGLAFKHVMAGAVEALEPLSLGLQDKLGIKRAFVAAQQRSAANLALASKLAELIGELIVSMPLCEEVHWLLCPEV